VTNQRTLSEIEATLMLLARVAGRVSEGERLLVDFRKRTAPVAGVAGVTKRPRIYFEEWNDPFVSGICWVSELIERAGGEDVFGQLRSCRAARDRVLSSAQIQEANPEIILASWCGEPVRVDAIAARAQWKDLDAIRAGRIYEIASEEILQPGFRLVEGFERIKKILHESKLG